MKSYIFSFSFFCLFFLFFYTLPSSAQVQQKYGLELTEFLKNTPKNERVPLLIEGREGLSPEIIQSFGGNISLQIGQLYSIDIPAKKIQSFSKHPDVLQIEFSLSPGQTLGDSMLVQVNADSAQSGHSPLPQGYTGKGVIIGVIDAGIELNHPDFQDSLGNTRVLYIWDQGVPFDPNRQANQYTYGVEWDAASINAKLSTHDDNPREFGHGSNVTGVAASNGRAKGNIKGVAPDANIITVATDFSKVNWLQTVAEAVDYIYAKADSLGLPCVINASIGTYAGGHDGKDIAARMIDRMIKEKNGRSFVCAAGNAARFPFHLQHQLQDDTAFTWFLSNPSQWSGQGGLFFTLWADTADFSQLNFSIGADEIQNGNKIKFAGRTAFDSISNRINVLFSDSIMGTSGKRIAKVNTFAEQSQGRYKLEVALIQPDSASYRFRLESRGTGKFDLWSSWQLFRHSDMVKDNLPDSSQFPEIVHYRKPDSNQTIVSSFTCLPSAITVGNYVNRTSYIDVQGTPRSINATAGEISVNSSLGPNRLGDLKPDISSAGDYMFAAGRLTTIQAAIQSNPAKVSQDSMHYRNGGTSMASPTVAGMVALYFEKCPKASYKQIQNQLFNSAKTDSLTKNLPNNKWGRGKADAFRFLVQSNFSAQLISPSSTLCQGDTFQLQGKQSGLSYNWQNLNGSVSSLVTSNGNYFAVAMDSSGCKAISDTLSVSFSPLPIKPIIIQKKDSLWAKTNEVVQYQWFFNNQTLSGETDSILIINQNGIYFCEVSDSLGCQIKSDSLDVFLTGIETIKSPRVFNLYPNPGNGQFKIETSPTNKMKSLALSNKEGKVIKNHIFSRPRQQFEANWSHLVKGVYFLNIQMEQNFKTIKLIIH